MKLIEIKITNIDRLKKVFASKPRVVVTIFDEFDFEDIKNLVLQVRSTGIDWYWLEAETHCHDNSSDLTGHNILRYYKCPI